jgi:hypothetical protein
LPPFLPPSEGFLLALHRIPTHAFSAPFLTTFIRVRESFEASNPLPFCWCIVIFVPFVRVFAVAAAQRINVIVLSNYISSKRKCNTTTKRETLYLCVLCEYYIIKRKQNKESGRLIKALSRSLVCFLFFFLSRTQSLVLSSYAKAAAVCVEKTHPKRFKSARKKTDAFLSFFFTSFL